MESQSQQVRIYNNLYTALIKFEDMALDFYADGHSNKRVLTHPHAGDMKLKVGDSLTQYKNPYEAAYTWIKGEMLDI